MGNVTGIIVQGHIPIIWSVHIPVFLVTLLIAMSFFEVYILT